MRKADLLAANIGGTANDVEVAFYEALQCADIEKLMDCWADEDEVVCVHPGGARLVGVAAIRAAFDALFSNGTVRAFPERVRSVDTLASSVHSLIERIELMTPQGPQQAFVVATNVYHKTAQGWRLVAHHASPGSLTEAQEAHDSHQTLH
jgi:ketosteroid isomerase-like protein